MPGLTRQCNHWLASGIGKQLLCSLCFLITQGMEWEYPQKPPSPTNSVVFSDYYDFIPSSSSSSSSSSKSSYPPLPSSPSSPTFGGLSPSKRCRSKTPSESSCSVGGGGGGACQNPLLEEYRNQMVAFEDLSQIRGHILEFSRDQVCGV